MPPNLSPADFSFELPEELIARYPNPQRSAARLLRLLPTGAPEHHVFSELPKLLRPNDLLVFNNTKVIPARLYAHKSSGGRLQMLVERLLDARTMLLQIKAASKLQIGSQLRIDGCPQCTLEYTARCGSFYQVRLQPSLLRLDARALPAPRRNPLTTVSTAPSRRARPASLPKSARARTWRRRRAHSLLTLRRPAAPSPQQPWHRPRRTNSTRRLRHLRAHAQRQPGRNTGCTPSFTKSARSARAA